MLEAENEFIKIKSKIVFIVINFFGFCERKILELARSIILAIKILRIISVEDSESMLENCVIDHSLLDEINQDIDIGTITRRVAILTHQYGTGRS